MFKRKLLAFICTAIISVPIIGLVFMFIEGSTLTELPALIAFTSIYAIPVTLLFGIPVSILSDKMNNRFDSNKRVFFSLVVHLFFSTSFIVLLILILDSRFILTNFNSFDLYFLVAATLISFIGWGMDEILRTYFRKTQKTFY
ncbi:hypothetical protein DCE79_05990 [Lysinibacillus sp. 2017]|uniref:hypothetical protein n=1 Tax=unclassified Lysinibacillus TaxID=2636778 RepID=UPI000D5296E5|nr:MULTISPECIES: hypothetical protein [unclassified Lysinibacillus]AWE06978.1 hypothetical protein DCE79_05990 [Lysinibacillus sp. 2017]TGN37098.1 hypothetical protein E4L99_01020 [Lysinibacillus sp. S2017]